MNTSTAIRMLRKAPRAIQGARTTLGYLAARPIANERQLIETMSERTAEVLDPEHWDVTTNGSTINIASKSGRDPLMQGLLPFLALRLPVSPEQRLKYAFDPLANAVARCLLPNGCCDAPDPGAEPHVLITEQVVEVWWGTEREAGALARMRPIVRSELGV